MEKVKLYRKRFIPQEVVLLKHDEILFQNQDVLITRWKTLKPRKDFQKGISVYFLKKGYKISKFYQQNGKFVYYYCDVVDTKYHEKQNCFVFSDLLADVIEYPDGRVKVVDVAEIAEALENGLISTQTAQMALRHLEALLQGVYQHGCEELLKPYLKHGDIIL